jgi:hypothetical protein
MKKFSAAFAALAVAAPGAMAAGNSSTHFVKVQPSAVKKGKKVRVYGSVAGGGCAKGSQATLYSRAFKGSKHNFAGIPAVFATVDNNFNFSVKVKISKKVKKGKYKVSGRCGGGNFGRATLTVKKAGSGGSGGGGGGFY